MKFQPSRPLTIGVELELQVIDARTGQLLDRASELVRNVDILSVEVTQAMVEYNSPVCDTAPQLHETLTGARDVIRDAAKRLGLGICGGGLHSFHRWPERQVSGGERFEYIRERYAYLAQMFTVFGLHIHIGCRDGQDALYLTHALSPYMPHFIALSASSPFYRNTDTGFDCARLNVLTAFPTSGTAPCLRDWKDFERHMHRLKELRVANSIKDLYWDIRPKPDTGTIEIRVCDTPLTVVEAADLAAFAQLLCCDLLQSREASMREDAYLPYRANRFQACRYGLEGEMTDPRTGVTDNIRTQILCTLQRLWPLAKTLNCEESVARLAESTEAGINGAVKLRRLAAEGATYPQIVAAQAAMWGGEFLEIG